MLKFQNRLYTYSEICTNISSPEEFEVIKPWPFDRLNIFTFPSSVGFSNALADLITK
jgi:hypothetical protein